MELKLAHFANLLRCALLARHGRALGIEWCKGEARDIIASRKLPAYFVKWLAEPQNKDAQDFVHEFMNDAARK